MTPTRTLLALAVAATLGACATTPPTNADLTAAQAALREARAQPMAERAASVELQRADQALRAAEAEWANDRDVDDTRQLAYVAQRRAQIAQAVATQAQYEQRVSTASTERDRIRLQARTQEAQAAAQQAQVAQQQAQAAQQQARAAQTQAATAQQAAQSESERAAALERDLKTLQGRATPRGMLVTLSDVLFATGSADLQPGAQRTVAQLAAVLQQYPERKVRVDGFTDSVGSDESNLALSERRAQAFAQALIARGVPADRLIVTGRGEADPVADNSTPAGRQQNRRVEVLFSDGQGNFAVR